MATATGTACEPLVGNVRKEEGGEQVYEDGEGALGHILWLDIGALTADETDGPEEGDNVRVEYGRVLVEHVAVVKGRHP